VVSIVLLVAVVAAGLAALHRGGHTDAKANDSVASMPSSPPTTASAATSVAGPLDATVADLERFVSDKRALPFLQHVNVTMLDDAAFVKRLELDKPDAEAKRSIEEMSSVLKALGLLSPDTDLATESTELARQGIVGLYRPDTKELLVRATEPTPYARTVLVHELTHALDDQHFGLDRHDLGTDLEESSAFTALVEGDAVRVEHAYIATMSPADRAAAEATERSLAAGVDVKQQTAYYFDAFPYLDGPVFVEALAHEGGEDAVNAAFASPPKSTAEILVPHRYAFNESGIRLSAPPIPGTAFNSGMLGALGLFLLLQDAVSPQEAAAAAVSWEGDLYLAWHDGARTCVTARFLLDTPWTAAFTAKLFARWAAKQVDAHVEAPGTVIVTSCR